MKQICEFLGFQYSDAILDQITEHTTFKSMKKNPMTNPDSFKSQRDEAKDVSFMRKGKHFLHFTASTIEKNAV